MKPYTKGLLYFIGMILARTTEYCGSRCCNGDIRRMNTETMITGPRNCMLREARRHEGAHAA